MNRFDALTAYTQHGASPLRCMSSHEMGSHCALPALLPMLLLFLLVAQSWASMACTDPQAVGAVQMYPPRIESSEWLPQRGVHKVTLRVVRMSNGQWPARVQILATETPWMDHGADCRSRTQDKIKSCFTSPVSSGNTTKVNEDAMTVFMTRLPDNREHLLFARSMACADDRYPHTTGWTGGVLDAPQGTVVPDSQGLTVRAISDSLLFVSALLPATGTYSVRISQQQTTGSILKINASTSGSGLSQDVLNVGSMRRVNLYVPTSQVDQGVLSRGAYLVQVTPGEREATVHMRLDSNFDAMVQSILRARAGRGLRINSVEAPPWVAPSKTSVAWIEVAKALQQAQVTPEQYDDLLVYIAAHLAGAANWNDWLTHFDHSAPEPWVGLDLGPQGTLPLGAQVLSRLQIYNYTFPEVWKKGRRLVIARDSAALVASNVFPPGIRTMSYFPEFPNDGNTVKSLLDSGMRLESSAAGRYLLKVRFAPRFFNQVPDSSAANNVQDGEPGTQAVSAVETNLIGQEIVGEKRIPGFLAVQAGSSKLFELRKPSRMGGYYSLAFSQQCEQYLSAVALKEPDRWSLSLKGIAGQPSTTHCAMELQEKDADGFTVLRLKKPVLSSSVLFPAFADRTIQTEIVANSINVSTSQLVHPDAWSGSFGLSPRLVVSLSDRLFSVEKNSASIFPASDHWLQDTTCTTLQCAQALVGTWAVMPSGSGIADLEARLMVDGRAEPLLQQTLRLSSVSIVAALDVNQNGVLDVNENIRTKPGVWVPASSSLLLKLRVPTSIPQGETWFVKLKRDEQNGIYTLKSPVGANFGPTDSEILASTSPTDDRILTFPYQWVGTSAKLGDITIVAELWFQKGTTKRLMDQDTLLLTNGLCATLPSGNMSSGAGRYVLNTSMAVDSGYPDREGLCQYSHGLGQVKLATFPSVPATINKVSQLLVPAKLSVTSNALTQKIQTVSADSVAAPGVDTLAQFNFGPVHDTSGLRANIFNIHMQETFLSGTVSVLEGSLAGSFLQVDTLRSNGFRILGISGDFAMTLPNWDFQLSGLAGTTVTRNYIVDSKTVAIGNVVSQNQANGSWISGVLQVSPTAPIIVAPSQGDIRFQYNIFTNRLILGGYLDYELLVPLDASRFGLPTGTMTRSLVEVNQGRSTVVLSSSIPYMHLRLRHEADGKSGFATYAWDDWSWNNFLTFHHWQAQDVVPVDSFIPAPAMALQGQFWSDSLGLEQAGIAAAVTFNTSLAFTDLKLFTKTHVWQGSSDSLKLGLKATKPFLRYAVQSSHGDFGIIWVDSLDLSTAVRHFASPQGLVAYTGHPAQKVALAYLSDSATWSYSGAYPGYELLFGAFLKSAQPFWCYSSQPSAVNYGIARGSDCSLLGPAGLLLTPQEGAGLSGKVFVAKTAPLLGITVVADQSDASKSLTNNYPLAYSAGGMECTTLPGSLPAMVPDSSALTRIGSSLGNIWLGQGLRLGFVNTQLNMIGAFRGQFQFAALQFPLSGPKACMEIAANRSMALWQGIPDINTDLGTHLSAVKSNVQAPGTIAVIDSSWMSQLAETAVVMADSAITILPGTEVYPLALSLKEEATGPAASQKNAWLRGSVAHPTEFWITDKPSLNDTIDLVVKLRKNMLGWVDLASLGGVVSGSLSMKQSIDDLAAIIVKSKFGNTVKAAHVTGYVWEQITAAGVGTIQAEVSITAEGVLRPNIHVQGTN